MRLTRSDVFQFAEWSGDRNPLHVDEAFARRTFFGGIIAHGMLSALRVLSEVNPARRPPCQVLDVEFRGAVFPDVDYAVDVSMQDGGIAVALRDGEHALLFIRTGLGVEAPATGVADTWWATGPRGEATPRSTPADAFVHPHEVVGCLATGEVPGSYGLPVLAPVQARVLALCSYVVGMEVPGLRSLLTRARLHFGSDLADSPELRYRVRTTRFDRAFRILDATIDIVTPAGRLVASGELRSYVRFSPVAVQPAELATRLGPAVGSLEGAIALVCGGTRGLGADLTAALAVAGCHVYASYRSDADAAAELRQALGPHGARVEILQGDAGDAAWCAATLERIRTRHGRVDLVVLNACAPPTPLKLGPGPASRFNEYISRNLPLALMPLSSFVPALAEAGGAVVCVSSSFVEERPSGFAHYVALKEAVESAVRDAVRQSPGVAALIVRPPRLQTAWNDTPAGAPGTIPSAWAAARIVGRLARRWTPGAVEVLSEFAPFEDVESAPGPAGAPDLTVAVAASFTAEPLGPGLAFWSRELGVRARVEFAPYGQILQSLLDPASVLSRNTRGLNVVCLRVKDWLRELPEHQATSVEYVRAHLAEASQDFERAMRGHRAGARVDTLVLLCPSGATGPGEVDALVDATERRLAASLSGLAGLSVLRAATLHAMYEVDETAIHDALREHIAHVPYKTPYFHVLATIVARRLHRLISAVRKVVAVDCDNTLWRGVVGEVGAEGLDFDAGHQALHDKLTRLSESGVLVALCSKNDEADVWRVFDTRPELRLPRSAIVAAMINWQPKSDNLKALASRLNLGLDSFIFIDDNPVECAEVRAGVPDVLTLEWPQDAHAARRLLEHTWELDEIAGTAEDRKRTEMYRQELRRQELRASALTFRDFLDSLNLEVDIRPLDEGDLKRASQLTLRTNQFNFTTRRRDESEMQALLAAGTHEIRTVRVRDRFGDYGLVGLLIAEGQGDVLVLDTFLMSCRVLGRGAEYRMANELGRIAEQRGASRVRLTVLSTKRNAPARRFLETIAPAESRRAVEGVLECELPAAYLRDLRFEPEEATAEPTTETEPTKPPTAQAHMGSSPRAREALIARTVSELCTMEDLSRAIDGHTMVRPATAGSDDVESAVIESFAAALRLPAARVREVDRLEVLGCDSFKIVEITVALSERFPWLPNTLLFEHRSVSEIVRHVSELSRETRRPEAARRAGTLRHQKESRPAATDIAVVGLDVRCAGARSPDELWQLLSEGRSAVTRVPEDRRCFIGRLTDRRPHWAGFIEDVDLFDAEFFGISPREAELMDPQLRLFLQAAWRALEDAGCTAGDLETDTGVFAGVMYSDYACHANEVTRDSPSPYKSWESFSLANRLSQVLGFRGPSVAIDTACSSSGTALHLACRALRDGDCRMAIVGGVNLVLDPDRFSQLGKLGILSPTGRCLAFGAEADGTVLGEGVGVVVLRPLADAVARGDRIYGVIKGTGVSTGSGTVGFTAPNPQAQAEAIRRALLAARVDPRTIGYVETHGTGTLLGDPIEVRGLELAYADPTLRDASFEGRHRCAIGSIKPNVGHLEAGAGVVSLIKVLLQLDRGMLVPSITSPEPNPQIPFGEGLFFIQRTLEPWPRPVLTTSGQTVTLPRRAGLSSFGVGGANVHVIVEEAPANRENTRPAASEGRSAADRSCHVLVLSARSEEALHRGAQAYRAFLESHPDVLLADVCHSANTLRRHFERRVAVIAASRDQMVEELARVGSGTASPAVVQGVVIRSVGPPKLAFLFTGQGSQYPGMGQELYETQPVFRAALDRAAAIFDRELGKPLLSLLFADPRSEEAALLDQTGYTQPALFALQIALAEMWRAWGIEPAAVMGHSVGEIAALCVAGGLSLDDGLRLVAARGRLMQALPAGGAMASVMAPEAEVAEALAGYEDRVSIAALNAPNQTVISGEGAAVEEIAARLGAAGIKTTPLVVSHAFHSPLMRPMVGAFERILETISFRAPAIPLVSGVTGRPAGEEITRPEYWIRQVLDPVRFMVGMRALDELGVRVYLEVGPQPVLLGLGRQSLRDDAGEHLWVPTLRKERGAWQSICTGLARLHVQGVRVDWQAFDAPYGRRRVAVPTYQFAQKRYWLEALERRGRPAAGPAAVRDGRRREEAITPGARTYRVEWRPLELSSAPPECTPGGRWVILADAGGAGVCLARALASRGMPCSLVYPGDRFRDTGDGSYRVSPGSSADFAHLVRVLASKGHSLKGVVHLWSLDVGGTMPSGRDGLQRLRQLALESVVHLVNAVAAAGLPAPPATWLVTRAAMAPDDGASGGPVAVPQAAAWGLGRTIALEYPELWGGLIDLDPELSGEDEADMLALELLTPGDEDQVALRGGRRLVPRLLPFEPDGVSLPPLASDGAYLVTGGLGALGLRTAAWLASRGARRLVLASRSGRATEGASKQIEAIESLGVTVDVVAADVSRREDVERIIAHAVAGGAELRGIVHAAGADLPGSLREQTAATIEAVVAPKLDGAWWLHESTRDLDLDFFVMYSSLAGVIGAAGRAHYAAANAGMDALALERRRQGYPAVSVGWGPWKGGGMATSQALREFERAGNRGLEPAEALKVLEQLIAGDDAQVIVADVDWTSFRAVYEARRRRPLVSEAAAQPVEKEAEPRSAPPAGSGSEWLERLRAVDQDRRLIELKTLLRCEAAETLGFRSEDEVQLDRSFYEMGMDSLMAAEFAMKLETRLGVRATRLVFDHPYIDALAKELSGSLALDTAAPAAAGARSADDVSVSPGLPGSDRATPAVRQVESSAVQALRPVLVDTSPGSEHQIFEFQRVAWPNRRADWIIPRWRWMFVESARRLGVQPRVWVCRDGERIVAHNGAIPVKLKVGAEERLTAWLVETMVLEEYRSQALGSRLMVEAHAAVPFALSLGQTEQMRQIQFQLGWVQVAPLRTAQLLIRPERVLKSKLPAPMAQAASWGLRISDAARGLRRSGRRAEVRSIDRFDERHDRLWEAMARDVGCAVVRDASYLNWKYVDQPGQEFVRLELADGDTVLGVVVLMFRGADAHYRYDRAFLVDLVAPLSGGQLLADLVAVARERAMQGGADALVCHHTDRRLGRALRQAGFLSRAPERFLLVRPGELDGDASRLLVDADAWVATHGDSDIDRPW